MGLLNNVNSIWSDERKGNLHIKLQGRFGVDTAMELTSHMSKKYRGKGNIFIHTKDITDVSSQSKEMFCSMLGVFNLPQENIYLLGEKGKDICHDVGKVIVSKEKKQGHNSCGKCRNCKCKPTQIN